MASLAELPKYDELLLPTLQVLVELGGSGTNSEIEEALAQKISATQEQLDIVYPTSGAAVLYDRMSWARSFLRLSRMLQNPKTGVWVLTEEGSEAAKMSAASVKAAVKEGYKLYAASKKNSQGDDDENLPSDPITVPIDGSQNKESWNDVLLERLQSVDAAAFERLCQRLLRESGFTRVEVTGKAGDGGIDGVGVLRMNLISFQVLFQCKRWKSSVGSEVVRNFRGAMMGRADKGIIITTSTFTSDARKEATRDGAPAIDLIDGEALCILMKNLSLGVRIRPVTTEEVTIDEEFFKALV